MEAQHVDCVNMFMEAYWWGHNMLIGAHVDTVQCVDMAQHVDSV